MPAAAGMIGTMFPPGQRRTYAFVAVSCGKLLLLKILCPGTDARGGAGGASYGMLIAGAFVEYTRYVHCAQSRVDLTARWRWRPCYLVGGLIFFWPWATVAWSVPADPAQEKDSKLDWVGSLLMEVSLFLLSFGFTSSQTELRGWRTPCRLFMRLRCHVTDIQMSRS
jgi:MFS family permease